jgi:tRNA(Ile)-lysidine synthase
MPRSHPPALLALTSRTIREECLIGRGDTVLVAVSGGPDSMALLHVLALLRARLGHALIAHGVDHGLRAEAAAELDLAAQFARSLEVGFERTALRVAPGGNLQARARGARYDALRAAAARTGSTVIATAHHRDDRAETVLLRLLRGAGPRGLAALPPRAGDLVRPLLRAPRAAIDAHIARHHVPFAVDPSNRDPRFLRVRVRQELLPLLRELSPGIDEHLCALADQLDAVSNPATASSGKLPLGLARASRQALAALVSTRSRTARIPLKRGLVARWDIASQELAVEPAPPLRRRSSCAEAGLGPREAFEPRETLEPRETREKQGASGAPDVPPPPRRKNK